MNNTENNIYLEKVYDYLHSVPEVGLKEYKTSKFISNELKEFGYNVIDGIAETGIIASLDSGREGPVLAIRADMDALEFEINNQPINIHACGHDANSAMVLSAAKEFSSGINNGKLVFIFQPAEEVLGGAIEMAKSGYLDDVEELIGIHLRPIQEAKLGEATPALCHGSSKKVTIQITGRAAHGARPHLGINAIDASALAIGAINSIKADPRVPSSAKVTNICSAGKAHNIIPDRVDLTVDVRAQTNEIMDFLISKIESAVCNSVSSIGASVNIKVGLGVLAAVYDSNTVSLARHAIEDVLGCALDPIVTPGGEDFHYYNNILNVKTAYIGLGANLTPGLHHPDMSFDKKALTHGRDILINIINRRLD